LNFTIATFEQQVADSLANRSNYVYEGHFTTDSTWDTPRTFKAQGYTVNLIFFGLENPEASHARVAERAREGGHWVDFRTIEDNFYGNLQKPEQHIDTITNIQLIDASNKNIVLAEFNNGLVISSVPSAELPMWFINYLP
jgi:predicted ABC-type ATPase